MAEWTQTETEVRIKIPLKGGAAARRPPDIVLLEKFVKVNSPPYYFEGYLTGEIDETQSVCRIFQKEIRLILLKKIPKIWNEIFENIPKQDTTKIKMDISTKLADINQQRDKDSATKRDSLRKEEIHKQIERDSVALKRIENITEQLKKTEFEKGETNLQKPSTTNVKNSISVQRKNTQIIAVKKCLPPPAIRKTTKIEVSFSKYELKTPKRQSQEELRAKLKSPAGDGDAFITKSKILKLQQQGYQLLAEQKFPEAILAFSEAVDLDQSYSPNIYVGRASAYFAMGKLEQCVTDCKKALEIFENGLPTQKDSPLKKGVAHKIRLGLDLYEHKRLQESYNQLENAFKLDLEAYIVQENQEFLS